MPFKPVLGPVIPEAGQRPVLGKYNIKPEFSYSFKYFHQIKYFGLENIDAGWFVSLIEKLKSFGNNHPEELAKNHALKDAWRYHIIDWNSKNIPIQRKDLNWIEKEIIENEEEFPIWQFQVSTARGRIIGFWYEAIFYIILLDPFHNMQPSAAFNYKVDDCYPKNTLYDSLMMDIENALSEKCHSEEACPVMKKLKFAPSNQNQSNALVAYIDDDYLAQLNEILEKKSFSDLIKELVLQHIPE